MGDCGLGGQRPALAAIYDASANPPGEYQWLVNISSRGTAEAGDVGKLMLRVVGHVNHAVDQGADGRIIGDHAHPVFCREKPVEP